MTAVAEAPPSAVAAPFRILDREQIVPSPLNPRKHCDVEALRELAGSFADVGIIEPLVVRPIADGPAGPRFEIVAGERRWRAAGIAQLAELPVVVRELSDTQALEIMVIENNQRVDVSPLEEADGFSRLMRAGYDVDRLAERLGRSTKYVYDRVKLLDLVPTAQQLLAEGKLTAGHGILLARLKPEQQEKAIDPHDGGVFQADMGSTDEDDEAAAEASLSEEPRRGYAGFKSRSVRELQAWIARHIRFDIAHAAQAAPLEFGEVAARVSEATARPGRGRKVISITFEHVAPADTRDGDGRIYGSSAWSFADGAERRVDRWSARTKVFPRCEHSVLGVVVAGREHYSEAFEVCIARDKCKAHWKDEVARKEKAAKQRARVEQLVAEGKTDQAAAAEAKMRDRQAAHLREQERAAKIRDLVERRATDQALERVKELTPALLRHVLAYLLGGDVDHAEFARRFGVKSHWNMSTKPLERLSGQQLVRAIVFGLMQNSLAGSAGPDELAATLGVHLKKVEAEVEKELAAAEAPAQPREKTPGAKSPSKAAAKKPAAKSPAQKKKGKKR